MFVFLVLAAHHTILSASSGKGLAAAPWTRKSPMALVSQPGDRANIDLERKHVQIGQIGWRVCTMNGTALFFVFSVDSHGQLRAARIEEEQPLS